MTRPEQKKFSWSEESPYDLTVRVNYASDISHEVLYEEDINKMAEHSIFLGKAIPHSRYYAIFTVFILLICGLLFRAFWMQTISHQYYVDRADRNRLRYASILPSRGMITDRNGVILANNIFTFDLSVTPIDLPQSANERNELLGRAARITASSLSDFISAVASSTARDQNLVLVRDLSYEQAVALNIELADTPAFHVEVGQKRKYSFSPQINSLSHILGYVGKISQNEYAEKRSMGYSPTDLIGKTGVESNYESYLRGTVGERVVEVDAFGRETRVVHETPPIEGNVLQLSIDLNLQRDVEMALRKGLEAAKVQSGAAIVIDPNDGSILAMVSWPSYDNNLFSGHVSSTQYVKLINDSYNPLFARAWAGLYPSGSTIKPAYAAAALAEGVISSKTTILSSGGIRIGSTFFPDWNPTGHGLTDVRRAIAWSVNTFFYTICGGNGEFKGLGIDKVDEWLKKFGFGKQTGLDLPGESFGFIPSPQWKQDKLGEKWYQGDTYNVAIGQGAFLVTPLQIALETSEIANNGKVIVPHVAKNVYVYAGVSSTEPIAPANALATVRAGMRDTIVYGSGRSLFNMPFTIAGKTGTAQWRKDAPNHAWFTAFAPYENPKVVVTVLLESGGEGSSTAIPVARDIFNSWYARMGNK